MPKAFTKQDKEHIDAQLIAFALQALAEKGIKKTTVSELTTQVGISKGEFYHFYPSKEALFFKALETVQDGIKATLIQTLSTTPDPSKDFIPIIMTLKKEIEAHPYLLQFRPDDFAQLQKKLDPEVLEKHFSDDEDTATQLLTLLHHPTTNSKILAGALRMLFLSLLHKNEIGDAIYDDVFHFVITSLFKEKTHD